MATATATLQKMYIDGKWVAADSGRTLGVLNPATEEVVSDVAYGGRAETKRAVQAAHKAMPAWMKLTPYDRAKVLKKTAELMRERADAIARTLTMEQGKPLAEAGLPAGVANLVIGPAQEMADEFLENPVVRKISFTGSTEVGKQLMRAAADQVKRLSLELGGHAPFIVFPDADPEVGAKLAVTGKFRNNGQGCIAPSRFYVHKDVENKFTEAAAEFAKNPT